jgi:hypothetical protein
MGYSCPGEDRTHARREKRQLIATHLRNDPMIRTALDNRVSHLYHYQVCHEEHLTNTLERGIVKFANPNSFNDPWDCKPTFCVPEDAADREDLVQWMAAASAKHDSTLDTAARARRVEEFISNPQLLKSKMAEAAAEMWRQIDKRYRVYCLTTKPDCPLMWAHYADHHRGVCLEFDMRKPDLCAAIQVQYREMYPSFHLNDGKDLSPLYTKSFHWQYEEEYRLIAQEESSAFPVDTMITSNQLYHLPAGSLTSIIIGARASEQDRRTIREIVSRSNSGLLSREARCAPDRYELMIDPPI